MKKQKLGLALAALCVPLIGATALAGSAFAEGEETPTMYSASDFGDDADFFTCIKNKLEVGDSAIAVSADLVKAVTSLNCGITTPNIQNVAGLNLFTSLTSFNLGDQANLQSVNLSGNTTLETFSIINTGTITNNTLSQVTFANNTALKYNAINNTGLTTINLAGAPNVQQIDLHNNKLASVNVSENSKAYLLVLSNNNLSTVDISACKSLRTLYLYGNNLTTLDATKASATLLNLYLDDNVLVKTDFIARQIDNGGKYYAGSSTNGGSNGKFIPIITATGLLTGYTTITTPGAAFYDYSQNSKCISGDAWCIMFDADITNYQNYIQLKYVGEAPSQVRIDNGTDPSKQNYRLEINLQAYDPNILVPDTGFFTGEMDGTKVLIYTGAAVLGAGALYLIVYSAKRGLHRNRFRR